MGMTLSIECPRCDYAEDRVRVGDGIAATLEIRHCTACQRIVSVTVAVTSFGRDHGATVDADRCPYCENRALQAWSHGRQGNATVAPCPVCAGATDVRPVARWH